MWKLGWTIGLKTCLELSYPEGGDAYKSAGFKVKQSISLNLELNASPSCKFEFKYSWEKSNKMNKGS